MAITSTSASCVRRRGDDGVLGDLGDRLVDERRPSGCAACGTSRCPAASACRTADRSAAPCRAGRCGRRARSSMYRVKYSRWASLIALSDRSGCSHFGSFCSARCNRSLNVQPSRTRYHARYSGTSRSSIRTASGTGVRNCSNGAAQCARALEDRQRRHPVLDLRADLHRAGAVADHRHALAGEVEVVRPRGGVDRGPAKRSRPGMSGYFSGLKMPGRADHGVRTASRRRRRAG